MTPVSPKVSVVMSVFNGQAFLSEAIESILNQTFRDFEFVIIDDGSTDKTPEILSAYAGRDARVRVHRQENRGLPASLNVGISLASGRYIARMDADDISAPTRFQEQVGFLEQRPEVGILGGWAEIRTPHGHLLEIHRTPLEDSEIRSAMLIDCPFIHPSVVMRKEILLAIEGYREVLADAEDYDLFFRLSERCQLANLPKVLVRKRMHANQVTARRMQHQVVCCFAIRAAALLRQAGKPDPLSNVKEVNLEVLDSLGINRADVQRRLLAYYGYWIHCFKKDDPDTALKMIEDVLHTQKCGLPDRSSRLNAWLVAAGIYYRKGRPLKAASSAARAFFLKPSVAGHLLKRGLGHTNAAIDPQPF